MTDSEAKVIAVLTTGDERSVDEVIRASGLPASAVNVALFSLEMKKLVRQLPGKLFVRNGGRE